MSLRRRRELNVKDAARRSDKVVAVGQAAVCASNVIVSERARDKGGSRGGTHLVERLGLRREVVPEVVGVLEVGLRVTLLRVDEVGELCRVAQEEDGRVVLSERRGRGVSATFLGGLEASLDPVGPQRRFK